MTVIINLPQTEPQPRRGLMEWTLERFDGRGDSGGKTGRWSRGSGKKREERGALPFVIGGTVGLLLVAVGVQWPEIQRYLKMRSM